MKETEDLTQLLIYEMGLERLIKLFPTESRETIKKIIEEQTSEKSLRKRFDKLLEQEIKLYHSIVLKVSGEWFYSTEKDTLVII